VIVYVPTSVQNGSESLGLKALEDFDVGIGGCPHSCILKSIIFISRKIRVMLKKITLLDSICFVGLKHYVILLYTFIFLYVKMGSHTCDYEEYHLLRYDSTYAEEEYTVSFFRT
jgi:hypothetical protein